MPEDCRSNTEDTPNQSMELIDDKKDYYVVVPVPTTHPTAPEINTSPIQNYAWDIIFEEDVENGWEKVENDQILDHGPFLDIPGPNLDTKRRKPEVSSITYLMTKCLLLLLMQQMHLCPLEDKFPSWRPRCISATWTSQ